MLEPFDDLVNQRFETWLQQHEGEGSLTDKDQMTDRDRKDYSKWEGVA